MVEISCNSVITGFALIAAVGALCFIVLSIGYIIFNGYTHEPYSTITIQEKAIDLDLDELLVLDTNGNKWVVGDPFLYNKLEIGETYGIVSKGYVSSLSELFGDKIIQGSIETATKQETK